MLTDNKEISSKEYWNKIYNGGNKDAKVDSSNTVRPPNPFDRFDIVVNLVNEGPVLDIGSGHARICQRLKIKYPMGYIVASDPSDAAKEVSKYDPYVICSGYDIPFPRKMFTTVICSQAMEYMEFPDKFLEEAQRVGKYFICTVPKGLMQKWSQLRIYDENNLKEFLIKYGEIEAFQDYGEILLAKIKFYK